MYPEAWSCFQGNRGNKHTLNLVKLITVSGVDFLDASVGYMVKHAEITIYILFYGSGSGFLQSTNRP